MEKIATKVYCSRCKRETNHHILKEKNVSLSFEIHGEPHYDGFWYVDKYHIVQCMGCEEIAFLNIYTGEDCGEYDDDGHHYYETIYKIYPEKPKMNYSRISRIEVETYSHVPSFISQVYQEVIASFNNESTLLPAAGLRTIVEAICNDVKVEKGFVYENGVQVINDDGSPKYSKSLYGKINGLNEKGIITVPQRNVLHQVRELGNNAVHDTEFPKRKTVTLGIKVIENILNNIYELDKFNLHES